MRIRFLGGWLVLLVMAVGIAGCSDDSTSDGTVDGADGADGVDASDGPVDGEPCKRDPALIEARSTCNADDLCPCGTHCDLGVCVASCSTDGDCGEGLRCDDFGRCSVEGEGRVAPLSLEPVARLTVSPTVLRIQTTEVPFQVRLGSTATVAGRARLVGRGGVQVQCGPGGEFNTECVVETVPPGGVVVSVKTSAVPALKPGSASTVHGGLQITTVRPDEAPGVDLFDGSGQSVRIAVVTPATLLESELTGVYEGFVWLESTTEVPGLGRLDFGRRAASLRVFGATGAYTVAVSEVQRGVLQDQLVLATTRQVDGTLEATLPALPVLVEAGPDGETAELSLPSTPSFTGRLSDDLIELTFDTKLLGLDLAGTGLPVRLVISATRVTDLEDGQTAPSVTDDVSPNESLDRGTTPSPAFGVARSLADAGDPTTVPGDLKPFIVPSGLPNGTACFASTSEHEAVVTGYGEQTRSACLDGLAEGRFAGQNSTDDSNGSPLGYQCVSGDGKAPMAVSCEWKRTIDVQVGTGCGQCYDACVNKMETDCDDPFTYCQKFDPQVNCNVCQDEFFQDLLCDNPNDQDCYTACVSFCGHVNSSSSIYYVENIKPKCTKECAASGCTPAPVFVQEEVDAGDCDVIAAVYGCTPTDAAPGLTMGSILDNEGNVTWTVSRVCSFAAIPVVSESECAAAASCLTPASFSTVTGFDVGLSEVSGDPLCKGGVEAIFPGIEAPGDDDAALLATCEADLTANGLDGATLSELFGSSGCLDRGRFHLATDRAFAATRAGGHDLGAEALGHRLVQNWLATHARQARVALNLLREQLVLGKVADPTSDAVKALDASVGGWPAVLHPRIAGALLAMSPEVLANPDPRPRFGFDATDAVARARVGLAVELLDTLSEQFELNAALLDRAWFEGNASRLTARRETAGRLLRLANAVGLLAGELEKAARSHGTTTWETAWKLAAPRFQRNVESVARQLQVIDAGASPIGIEDEDLPLYYGGDPLEPNERFSAISRFLVGSGPDSEGLAAKAIATAREALTTVQDKWHERLKVKDINDQRIQDIKYRYGELITGFCGASIENDTNYAGPGMVECLNPGSQSVFDCPQIDTEFCFVEESCRPRAEAFLEKVTSADLAAQLCVFSGLRQVYGANLVNASPDVDQLLRVLGPKFLEARNKGLALPLTITKLEARGPNERVAVVDVDGTSYDVVLDALGALDLAVPESVLRPINKGLNQDGEPSTPRVPYQQIVDSCELGRQRTLALRPTTAPASCTIADECPAGQECQAGVCATPAATDPLEAVDCYYDGAISEQAIAVRGAADDIEIARREFEEHLESYDIAKRSCILLKAGNDAIESQLAAHNATMNSLDIARTALNSAASAAAAVKECAASFGVEDIIVGSTAGVCIGAGLEAGFTIAANVMEFKMGEAERKHEEEVTAIQNNTDESICFNDADMELVGAKAALMRVRRAQQDQAIAAINLRGLKSYTLGLFNEGNEAVAMEQARLERSLPSQFAVTEAAERFAARFDYARRVAYLAVRAVEYEFQASLAERQNVLAATRPDQLEDVLESAAAYVNAGRVNGSTPDALHAVVSLREHLLQLGDRTGDPSGQLALTDVERFRVMLTSTKYAEYDQDGQYLGQLIPFQISPLGTLDLGQSQGLPIVADNDCAERVWSVNAAVLGEGVYEGNVSSFTRLDLLKKNTFYSQRCDDAEPGDFQVASVRPAINLLQDPSNPNRPKLEEQDTLDYTRGRMQPYLNVSRADFEKEDYAQGSTTELAGRGLYGDYALFIPKAVLSLEGSPGLKLERITDILLRLDYVSVSRN